MSGAEPTANPLSAIEEAARQVNICNACRYCEGYCSVFPAITSARAFAEADIVQLANLCHNCRGCFYACQYAPPHEFGLNLPKALAEVRQESWEDFAFPRARARLPPLRGRHRRVRRARFRRAVRALPLRRGLGRGRRAGLLPADVAHGDGIDLHARVRAAVTRTGGGAGPLLAARGRALAPGWGDHPRAPFGGHHEEPRRGARGGL